MIEAYGPTNQTGIGKAFQMNVRALGVFDHVHVTPAEQFQTGDTLYVHSTTSELQRLADLPGFGRIEKRVAYFVWETDRLPDASVKALSSYTSVWTSSVFCAKALQKAGFKARVIPHAVSKFSLNVRPDHVFKFLTIFDPGSRILRKNPFDTLKAFEKAFGGRRDVHLTIKTRNLSKEYARVLSSLVPKSYVTMINQDLTEDEMDDLYAQHDGFISLHQSEGFGLTILEAMAHGMRVVYTDYSAPKEFAIGYPVAVDLKPSTDDFYEGAKVAFPDVDSAVEQLRACVDDSDEVRVKAFYASLNFSFANLIRNVGQAFADL